MKTFPRSRFLARLRPCAPHNVLVSGRCPPIQATSERNVKDVKAGFRWDPSMSRWIRDDKMVGYDAPVEIKPKSGAPYTVCQICTHAPSTCGALQDIWCVGLRQTKSSSLSCPRMQVWPVVHTDLTDSGLTSYAPAQVQISASAACKHAAMLANLPSLPGHRVR
jgi:hypothetical protein